MTTPTAQDLEKASEIWAKCFHKDPDCGACTECIALALAEAHLEYCQMADDLVEANFDIIRAEGRAAGLADAKNAIGNLDSPDIEFDWIRFRALAVKKLEALAAFREGKK